ncbi:MAG TPA: DNA methyltransferase [Planctomycetota bacterium]|nr:DNA methyltransferase [Planctomycetota bacterium]
MGSPYLEKDGVTLYLGDCLSVMAALPEASVDSIVTDPPYGLAFMGREWDHGVPGRPFWEAALRVAKPGAHLVAFGGTRTFHRLTCGIEDAGWEIRDCLSWLYGSGFPKSLNGKHGGTALKPAWEPCVLARKPLDGTVAANFQKHGTGGLNIDGCRLGYESEADKASATPQGRVTSKPSAAIAAEPDAGRDLGRVEFDRPEQKGRWPANVVLDEEAAARLDAEVGVLQSGKMAGGTMRAAQGGPGSVCFGTYGGAATDADTPGDSGGPSRFFYTAKASRSEREEGLENMAPARRSDGRATDIENPRLRTSARKNDHPTVKPVDLMRWLVRLVTPSGGVVLDPFMGSGSTLVAARREFFQCIGIDLEERYCQIAKGRLSQNTLQF